MRQIEFGENIHEFVLIFSQMTPALIVNRNQGRIREGMRNLERILAAHRHAETPARLRGTGV